MKKAQVCVSIFAKDISDLFTQIEDIDFFEIRFDLSNINFEDLSRLPFQKKIIATFRDESLSEIALKYLEFLIDKVAFIDIDFNEIYHKRHLIQKIKNSKTQLILSYHNYDEFSFSKASEIVNIIKKSSPEYIKFAQNIFSYEELLGLQRVSFLYKKMIIVGMGRLGILTRIFPDKFNSLFTYASYKNNLTASGQIDYHLLKEIHNFPDTKLFGVIGNPISHSKSPEIFHFLNINKYQRIHIDTFNELIKINYLLNLQGINITKPYKESILNGFDFIQNKSSLSAINTLRLNDFVATNTDVFGIKKTILDFFEKIEYSLNDFDFIILGFGGAGKAVCKALNDIDIIPTIFCRNSKTKKAVKYLQYALHEIGNDFLFPSQKLFVINTIPNHVFHNLILPKDSIILNAVYKDENNPHISGQKWLINQAIESMNFFYNGNQKSEFKIEGLVEKLNETRIINNIILVGFTNAGKSEIGKNLAKNLNFEFIDIDDEIEKEAKIQIDEIFSTKGELYFRKKEKEIIFKYLKDKRKIIILGGGAILDEEIRVAIKENNFCIWILRDIFAQKFEERPLLTKNFIDTLKLFYKRKDFYAEVADLLIFNHENHQENSIKALIQEIRNITFSK